MKGEFVNVDFNVGKRAQSRELIPLYKLLSVSVAKVFFCNVIGLGLGPFLEPKEAVTQCLDL